VIRGLTAVLAVATAVVAGFFPAAVQAGSRDSGETAVFSSVHVAPDETVHGNLNVIFGDARIDGHVTGDVNVVGGNCTRSNSAVIDGETHCAWSDAARVVIPLLRNSAGFGTLAAADRLKLAGTAIVVLMFLLFPVRMRIALDRVERHPGISAATGVVTMVFIAPVVFALLVVSVVFWPLLPLGVVAICVGVSLGTGAVALLIGRRLLELVMPSLTPSPLVALVLGLVIVSAAEIVPFVGWTVTVVVWLVGIGAAILSFFRTAGDMPELGRQPIGGPPMKSASR
jgi:hypothetical protein